MMTHKTKALRALIVDDSVVFRTFIRRCLNDMEGVEVVGAASDGKAALRRIEALQPDLITLDLEMPQMDGIEVLKAMGELAPNTKVVIVASETRTSAERVIEALEHGAFEAVIKPASASPADRAALTEQLQECLSAAARRRPAAGARPASAVKRATGTASVVPQRAAAEPTVQPRSMASLGSFRPDIIAIGSSTGGPQALSHLFKALPAGMRVPIVITQHMPKLFVESLAKSLDRESQLACHVAEDGMQLERGHVYLAPGEIHMEIARAGVGLIARLVDGEKVHHCKPAVDPMFFSLQRLAPSVRTLAVVLTGMGSDGAAGAAAIAQAGGMVIAQDEATSIVWGMPGKTVKTGAAHQVLALDDVAPALVQYGGQSAAVAGSRR
ncbi:MAG: chemotaxis-specific protein-glutamate methyltransferase CheB [Mariprofundus sp.]